MSDPVNRTILVLDIEQFGRRDDVEQAFLRRTLYDIVEDTLAAAGVERTQQYREDRGDGVIILISAEVSKVALLRSLLTTTPGLLHNYNRFAASSTQLRLRVVLAAGEIALDPRGGVSGGIVGHDLNQACRLLDAAELRTALRRDPAAHTALCVSDAVYRGIVRHGHAGLRPEAFSPVTVAAKEGPLTAWLYGPPLQEGPAPGAVPEATAPAEGPVRPRQDGPAATAPTGGVVLNFHGTPTIGGSVVTGDQHGVSGGQVTGDVILGSTDRGEHR